MEVMSRKLVAAIGNINAGKDTVMNKLFNKLVWEYSTNKPNCLVRCCFADSLNRATAAILGISEEELQDRKLKEVKRFNFDDGSPWHRASMSSRDVQKGLAIKVKDLLGEDVFIHTLDKTHPNPNSILLISDLRYQNELEWVRKQGGKVVYIHNEKAAQAQKARESIPVGFGDDKHYPPESELLQWDFYNRVETPDYWLDNNDFDNHSHFDDFVEFVLDYLEN
jgi:hypothetical protein